MHWSHSFYERQDALTGCYSAPIHPFHTSLAARVTAHRCQPGALLELGAGGGSLRPLPPSSVMGSRRSTCGRGWGDTPDSWLPSMGSPSTR